MRSLEKFIIEGRREEFRHFPAFNEPEELAEIPSPQELSSFHASKTRLDRTSPRSSRTHSGSLQDLPRLARKRSGIPSNRARFMERGGTLVSATRL